MKIGLYGGSFDPVHLGHLLVAQAAMEELGLDRLFFIPAAQSPFKPESPPAPAPLRLAMLRTALAGWTRCEVDDREIRRGGISYTVDTARAYKAQFSQAELFYLIGVDHVATLPKWREASELAAMLEFVAIPRPGQTETPPPAPFRVRGLSGFPLKLSSSEIRQRVGQGLSVRYLVPPGVEEMILNNRLYLRA